MQKFQVRYEEGYDITTDERYNLWLEMRSREPLILPSRTQVPSGREKQVGREGEREYVSFGFHS